MGSKNLRSNSSMNGFSSIHLCNFKSVKDSGIAFSPLTVILGSNSVGKSTVLQSLILLAQNAQRLNGSNLLLNGLGVKLGSFGELRKRNSRGETSVSFRFHPDSNGAIHSHLGDIFFGLSLTADDNRDGLATISKLAISQRHGEEAVETFLEQFSINDSYVEPSSSVWQVSFESAKSGMPNEGSGLNTSIYGLALADQQYSIGPRIYVRSQNVATWMLEELSRRLRIVNRNSSGLDLNGLAACLKSGIDWNRDLRSSAHHDPGNSNGEDLARQFLEEFQRIVGKSIPGPTSSMLLRATRISRVWPLLVAKLQRQLRRYELDASHFFECLATISKQGSQIKWEGYLYLPFEDERTRETNSQLQSLQDYLRNSIHYLGPLRVAPSGNQEFELEPSRLTPVGSKGEQMGYVLQHLLHEGRRSKYPLPPDSKLVGAVSLASAVADWANYFSIGEQISVKDLSQGGLLLQVDGENLYQKGTGVSQLLPVLLVCLMARAGSTVLIEQPELHLHPSAQQKLGDFFLVMTRAGRRLIIETHSEYLITRLRKLIAVDSYDSGDIGIVFAEKSRRKSNSTVYTKGLINEDGAIDNWPAGFFDYSSDDKLEIMLSNFAKS